MLNKTLKCNICKKEIKTKDDAQIVIFGIGRHLVPYIVVHKQCFDAAPADQRRSVIRIKNEKTTLVIILSWAFLLFAACFTGLIVYISFPFISNDPLMLIVMLLFILGATIAALPVISNLSLCMKIKKLP
ncbi:hypothetical protein JXB28_05180 [Candidatus Woesearchaeota archaeon]|nr:hypothetical protein [Candidatus Woesearchaeota archaeon]